MEQHIDQERDHKNPPRHNQESPMKLPLAPLVSTPPERLRDAVFSTRRGTSIFSPKKTLDQLLCEENPIQDPDPTTMKAGGAPSSRTPSQLPLVLWVSPHSASSTLNSAASMTYGECLKNHAASTGGHAVDGCREFMPSGEDGTEDSLECAACHCHRNFHRKDIGGEPEPSHFLAVPPQQQLHLATTVTSTPPKMVDFSGNSGGGVAAESSTEYLDMFLSSSGLHALMRAPSSGSKKRFRTKFNRKQKDMMFEFATRLDWRIQNEDDEQVHKFCNEVGVKRQVFKVWMHNNKKRQN
ncbi:ZF-HD homeobox protein-like [Dorcoceras hygrometricum]|uniref:ZF-HD homeobox protein-like n=1 Tax=Dorcoceras hygrometricum TaxID=472368 RepID=A0A2Z7ACE8_9LAMI|nr:ZF-HD homeobox protein-like [Dorcoceras hygrometricum]